MSSWLTSCKINSMRPTTLVSSARGWPRNRVFASLPKNDSTRSSHDRCLGVNTKSKRLDRETRTYLAEAQRLIFGTIGAQQGRDRRYRLSLGIAQQNLGAVHLGGGCGSGLGQIACGSERTSLARLLTKGHRQT